jgi:Arc/MetJ-type ribon-helix-helix transcriptional regulator
MTTHRKRHIKTPMTYRKPPDIERRIDALVDAGEYVNASDAVTALLRFALDHRNFDVATALKDYLNTDEGIELMKSAARRRSRKK